MHIRCPHCHNPVEVVGADPLTSITCPSCGSNFSLISGETASFAPGAVLNSETATSTPRTVRTIGHFDLLESLGEGHFGTVWKARDTKLDRTVAIKIPRRGQIEGPEAEMFIREARAAAQVKHPGIVGVHEVGREDGTLYIVSDFIDGRNLKEWLIGQQLTAREAAELCIKLAESLHAAHAAGVVHRDLKPGNVMMDRSSQPHLTDFGLAKREAGEITMTVDGQIMGTPAYMSPEQARGEAHTADARSDVYSLGVILFELLTGELPFRGNQRMMILQILHDDPPSPRKLQSRIPRDLETICLKCLEKEQAQRFQTAAEAVAELRRYLDGQPILSRPIGRAGRAWRWCQRNPVVATLLACVVVVLVAGTTVSTAFATIAQKNATSALSARDKANEASYRKGLAVQAEAEARRRAEREVRVATALRLAAQSRETLQEYPCRSLLLAVEAVHATTGYGEPCLPTVEQVLRDGLAVAGGKPLTGHVGVYPIAAISSDSRWTATATDDVRVWDLDAADPIASSRILKGHDGHVTAVAFSPDGQYLVSGGTNKAASLWDLKCDPKKNDPLVFSGHPGTVQVVAISPDNRCLAVGCPGSVTLWNLKASNPTAAPMRVLTTSNLEIVFSANSRCVALAGGYGSVQLWDLKADSKAAPKNLGMSNRRFLVFNLPEQQSVVNVAFSPDDHYLTAVCDGKGMLWDLTAANPAADPVALNGNGEEVKSVAFANHNPLLAVTSGRTVSIYRIPLEDRGLPIAVMAGTAELGHVKFASNDRYLMATEESGAHIWDLSVPNWSTLSVALRGHDGGTYLVAGDPARGRIVTLGADGGWRLWRTDLGRRIASPIVFPGSSARIPPLIAFSGDGHYFANVDAGMKACVWDLSGENPFSRSTPLPTPKGAVLAFAFSPGSRFLATGGSDGDAQLWDLTGKIPGERMFELTGHHRPVTSVLFSPDGHWLATLGTPEVRLWDVASKNPAASGRVFSTGIPTTIVDSMRIIHKRPWIVFSGNSRYLAAMSDPGTARVWDLLDKDPAAHVRVIRDCGKFLSHISFSADNRFLATGGDKGVLLWDMTANDSAAKPTRFGADDPTTIGMFDPENPFLFSGKPLRFWALSSSISAFAGFRELPANEYLVTISPHGKYLITQRGKAVRVWDVASKASASKPIIETTTDSFTFYECLFSSDNHYLMTSGGSNIMRLWDLTAESPASTVVSLRYNGKDIFATEFSPDSRWLAASGRDGSIHAWNLRLEDLLTTAKQTAGRELTADERHQYLLPVAEQTTKP